MTRDTAMAARPKARIVLIGTGGTIAGHGASSINTSAYDCSVLSIDDILADLPVAASIADIRTEQLFQFGSENFGNPQLLQLGKRISSLLKRDNIDGIVVTHGTDTIDETAYFLHLTLKSTKPVVVVGAMRPGHPTAPWDLLSKASRSFTGCRRVATRWKANGRSTRSTRCRRSVSSM